MQSDELKDIVRKLRRIGNDVEDVEAKRSEGLKLPKSVRETLSAFSNARGGVLILGLEESSGFTVADLPDAGKQAADLASVCATELEPPVRATIEVHEFEGKNLVTAEVQEMDLQAKPCYVKSLGMNKGSYTRVNDGDQRLTSYEIQLMLSAKGQPRDDVAPVPEATIDDLDEEGIKSYVARLRDIRPRIFGDKSIPEILTMSNVLAKSGDALKPTLAGLLALGRYPQQFYPQLMLTFVSYPTVEGPAPDGTRFLDNVAIEGSIPEIVRETLAVLKRNMSRRAIVAGAGRQDIWDYPEPALREAIVNAVVHRDLSPASFGTQVQVEMYPDRLEVRNPGGLFGPVQIDSLGTETLSSARNSALLKMLEDVKIPGEDRTVCENRGSGIRTMLTALRAAGMSTPEFTDKISSFTVRFPNHTLLNTGFVDWIAALHESGLTHSQIVALAHMREGALIDNPKYRQIGGVDSRVATQELQDLVVRELAEQEGTGRWATYTLAPRLGDSEGLAPKGGRISPADRRAEVLDALGTETLSRAALEERTSLKGGIIRRWLKILRDEGYVELVGSESLQSNKVQYRRTGRRIGESVQQELEF